MKKLFVMLLAVSLPLALSSQDLTILHLNDTHSHVEPERSGPFEGMGGAIEQAACIDSVRCADGKGNVLLLHAGDFSQGTSYFTELRGDMEIKLLNAMAFDAVCLGNHEFDNGIDDLARRLTDLDVPVVCANYDFSGTPLDSLVKPYVVTTKAGRTIGIIGLLTDVSSLVDVKIASKLQYQHPAKVAEKYAKILKQEKGCDLVICLTHLGYVGEFYTDQQLAAQARYVDIIVGGHSHTWLDDVKTVRNPDGADVRIVTDGRWGIGIGQLSVSFQKNRLTDMYL